MYFVKDPVTRAINGVGWSVMSDQESVQKAIQYFNSGEVSVTIWVLLPMLFLLDTIFSSTN